ncbi:uncharacterized protein [Nicotiana tomentosiformis]|uniref:uncharacterized protein n=1 Tax=Nicotiana tomentosiformis TaxID=4098 RepID=UPI00388C4B19
MVDDPLSKTVESISSLAYVLVGEKPLALDAQELANQLVKLDVSETSWKQSWADLVENEEECGEIQVKSQTLETNMKKWSKTVANSPVPEGFDLKTQEPIQQNIKITMEDINNEVEYWNNAVICYVLGSNPPAAVMNGYFHRIWGEMGIDKVVQVNRGVFLVRFTQIESRVKVVEEGVQMFDKKPVIVKPWSPEIDTRKETFSKVPIWIRLPELDIKYWGQNALTKIAGLVGNPLKANRATTLKERMTFARVLVEVALD